MTMSSIDYSKKLRQIREAEGLTQKQFAELTGLAVSTVRSYEGVGQTARAAIVEKVIQVDRFEKYMFWLMKDKTLPSAGQIAPALSLDGSIQSEANQVSIETPQKSPRSRRNAG
ncbi:helix-turn-helix transcriptional regulator [Salmonella enterica]|uniref:helix-turn-helix domain-containing protein n=1 Tax=Salmonella enterica TaxID=28901 RepID=UPI0009AD1FB6|nr:helix-turn-helix transcriptional regulator [Salmonella enterica]EEB4926579.1 helix-turn-helix domain-containing protein [Salmonella enterica subsp. enterica serovar Brandenburg]EAU6105656.1 XRE family transcriptional regulator [Salmonella enterica]EBM1302236.1 XRE family transcriptional regulator [Salmonella enterica]EBM5554575.1 XRE family transcriptional regulator [Salmonella enterica]EDM0558268.1 XRE family transcriptional regulator [Salmonella enterica]